MSAPARIPPGGLRELGPINWAIAKLGARGIRAPKFHLFDVLGQHKLLFLAWLPFSFVRVDRAGNMSKRQSATGFHFSSSGGTCPLWNVYETFANPGKILVQIAQMPDGRNYMWVARTVERRASRYGQPGKTFAIGLGCELRHAHRLVYSEGLDLSGDIATPIGAGCRVCERDNCPQRAFPALGRALDIDEHRSTVSPYLVRQS